MIPQVLTNCVAFIDGVSLSGEVPSLTLPKLTQKTLDYQGGGMSAPIEFAVGMEKLESAFTTNGVRRETLKYLGLSDQTACNLVFRGAYKGLKGAVTPVVVTMRGGVKEVDMGDWKPGDQAEIKHAVKLVYYKLEIDGRVGHESGQLQYVRELGGNHYLSKYDTGSLAARLGNTPEADGDGQRYRGRGLIQITGHDNYLRCSLALFGDERLLRTPELLELPQWAAESAAWFWSVNGLNALADQNEFNTITRRINGGLNGLQDRLELWERARAVLCVSAN